MAEIPIVSCHTPRRKHYLEWQALSIIGININILLLSHYPTLGFALASFKGRLGIVYLGIWRRMV